MDKGQQLAQELIQRISTYKPEVTEELTGNITKIADGVAKIS
jgi:hypothetical protein